MHEVLALFIQHPRSVPLGAKGDQAFYLWAIERAMNARNFHDYVAQCDWSRTGCFELTAIPQEWRSFFLMGRVARLLHVGSAEFISVYYYSALLLNVLAAYWFIARVSGNYVLAGVLAGVVGFQQSIVWRIQGHLSLISIWPLVLAMIALTGVVEDLSAQRVKIRFVGSLVLLGLSIITTALVSYYYFLFGLVLLPALGAVLLVLRARREAPPRLLTARQGLLTITALLATGAATAWVLLPALPNRTQQRHAESYERSADDVHKCSSRWVDYFKPTAFSRSMPVYQTLGLQIREEDIGDRWPWELHAFLGATFWAGLILTSGMAAWLLFRRRHNVDPAALAGAGAFTLMALAAASLGTEHGGSLLHSCVAGLRCFNRFAPFVALFGCCAIATAWSSTKRGAAIASLVLALIFVAEFWRHSILNANLVRTLEPEFQLAAEMRRQCGSGALSVSPISDFMPGPYRLYYVAQLARCHLDGISGPRTTARGSPDDRPLQGTVQWGPQTNGFEDIVLRPSMLGKPQCMPRGTRRREVS
jgi:hypothetical protein